MYYGVVDASGDEKTFGDDVVTGQWVLEQNRAPCLSRWRFRHVIGGAPSDDAGWCACRPTRCPSARAWSSASAHALTAGHCINTVGRASRTANWRRLPRAELAREGEEPARAPQYTAEGAPFDLGLLSWRATWR